VTAYNDNGDSAKSKAVSATLDSVAPKIVSVSPLNGAEIASSYTSFTVTISEKSLMGAISIVGNGGRTYGQIRGPAVALKVFPFDMSGGTGKLCDGDTITVTIKKRKRYRHVRY
jgi:hypothetical protein